MKNQVPEALEFFDDTQSQERGQMQCNQQNEPRNVSNTAVGGGIYMNNVNTNPRYPYPLVMGNQPFAQPIVDRAAERALWMHEEKLKMNDRHVLERSMRSVTVGKGSFGELRLDVKLPSNQKNSKIVSDARNITVTRFWTPMMKKQVVRIKWEREGKEADVWILGDESTPAEVVKKMRKKGFAFRVPAQFREEAMENLIEHFHQIEKDVEIPMRHGWNRRSDGSFYVAKRDDFTMKEAIRKCQKSI